jgi:hypothetical protein
VSFTFGPDVVAAFLKRHDLDLICRAHQVVEDGYEFFAKRQLVTLFSAPNYCGEFDNAGAMMSVDDTLMCSFQILKPAQAKKGLPGTTPYAFAGTASSAPQQQQQQIVQQKGGYAPSGAMGGSGTGSAQQPQIAAAQQAGQGGRPGTPPKGPVLAGAKSTPVPQRK